MKLYPKATQNRIKLGEHSGFSGKRPFIRAAAKNFVLLQLLFLGLFSYIFGSLYQQSTHIHNLGVAFVDYDGGNVGAAVRRAYGSLQADTFLTLEERSASDFPTPADLESAVCATRYWAALYLSPGASDRLQNALGGGSPALAYDPSNVLTYVWNEARYPVVADPAVASNLKLLSDVARVAYGTANGTGRVQSLSSQEAVSVFVNPWQLVSIDIQPTTQGSRAIYNTIVIILILIQEFFYLGTINGLYASFKIYNQLHPTRLIIVRTLNSLAYCFVGSLCTVGAIWAFRSGWHVNGNQFVLSWMSLWLFAHLNFMTLDVFSIWLPLPYVPMALITWILCNVTSILLPFELSPAFFQIGYIFPAHEVFQVLLDIWSGGCNPHLRYALPILFAWELGSLALSALGAFRRSHYASLSEEEQARQFNERLEAAMEFERKREREVRAEDRAEARAEARAKVRAKDPGQDREQEAEAEQEQQGEKVAEGDRADDSDDNLRQELADVIQREDTQIAREKRRASKTCGFGPSFDLPFGRTDPGDLDK